MMKQMGILSVKDPISMCDQIWTHRIISEKKGVPKYIKEFFPRRQNNKSGLRKTQRFDVEFPLTDIMKAGFVHRLNKISESESFSDVFRTENGLLRLAQHDFCRKS